MPSEAVGRWLSDIGNHIDTAQVFVTGLTYEAFREDLRTTYAVIRCLEIISEASRRLPEEMKAHYPQIAWKEMAAAGNVYRHDYEDVAVSAVWRTLKLSLPALREVVERELKLLRDAQ